MEKIIDTGITESDLDAVLREVTGWHEDMRRRPGEFTVAEYMAARGGIRRGQAENELRNDELAGRLTKRKGVVSGKECNLYSIVK